ncbi:uncharacterized protein V1513DRAFT_445111 [Lipomyces chichibuensis]|uniref:uncharacterized protein n=1 Tax=Lipomyces chichibuensis TaxID=1546026 RepID=UPI0033438B45
MNPLTISSVIACVCSVILAFTAVARILVKYVYSDSVSLLSFVRSKWFLLFGAFERRAIGISVVLLICSILNLIVSSRVGSSECNSEMNGSSVLPILLCLESVAIPICHLIFVLPSIVESLRTSPSQYHDSKLQSDMHSDNRLILAILKFAAKFFVFAGTVIVFWLPVYILYANDSSAFGTCFAQSGSMLWYMGSKTASAGSSVAICLIALLVSGMTAVFAYSILRRVSARNRGYRVVAYLYLVVGTLCTALTLPELLYRAQREQSDASEVVPNLFKYLTIASLPLHALLLCFVTVFAYIFVHSKDLDYRVPAADPRDIIDEKFGEAHFSLSFYASPRYEDKYLSVINPGVVNSPSMLGNPLTATSTASSQQKYEQAETESMHANQFPQMPGYNQMKALRRDFTAPFGPKAYYTPTPHTDTAVLPQDPHMFNFL